MNRAGVVVALLAAFFFGVSLGLVGGTLLAHRPPPFLRHGAPRMMLPPDGPPGRGGPERRVAEHVLGRLADELGLTPAQRERIRAALVRAHASHAAVRDSMHAAIERELTPEQRERWRRIIQRFPAGPGGPALAPPPAEDRP